METTLMSSGILNCLPIPSPPLRAASSSTSCFATSTSAQNLSFLTHQCRHSRRRAAAGGVLAPPLTTFSVRKLSSITCAAGAAVKEISEAQFSDTVLKSNCPVLVEFVAGWCGPCRLISPAIEAVAQDYKDKLLVVKIDHDANPQLIEEYKVYGLPALILFKDGEEVPESRREGAITKAKLKEYIDELLESVSVSQLQDFLSVTAIL